MEELVAAARRRFAQARAAAPGVSLGEEVFLQRVVAAVEDESDPLGALAGVHADDLFLACAAAAGDGVAVGQIDRRLRAQTAAVARSLGESRGFAEDLESDLRDHVLAPREGAAPRVGSYSGLGPLDGWLRVTATREALRLRKRVARSGGGGGDDEMADVPGVVAPELDYLKAAYRDHFRHAFRDALKGLDDRQRNLLRLHYGDGVGVERLGQMYRVHFSTVSRWISAARHQLFDATREAVRSRLGVSDEEFSQIMDLIRSHLDVTISIFLQDPK